MITLYPPEIIEDQKGIRVSAVFELENKKENLWYSFPIKFKNFIVTEQLDAFVVGLLFLALKTGNDLRVKGAISARLYYTINHYLIDALCLANPQFKQVKLSADSLNSENLNQENTAGTGLSCGVDSFATYFDHLNEKEPYRISYFTFFNVGSHGDFGGGETRNRYQQRYSRIKKFAEKEGKEIIAIDSNLSEKLKLNFQQTNTLRNVSCVLLLQKLFRVYYLASKNRFDYFKLHSFDTQDYDSLILSMLSTESTDFFSAVQNRNRVQRTKLITKYPATFDALDVCTELQFKNEKINCTECDKCLRTALTLDLLGELENYKEVFDLDTYRKNKKRYIGKLVALKGQNQINQDIYNLAQKELNINSFYLYSFLYKFTTWRNKKKKWMKSKLKNF